MSTVRNEIRLRLAARLTIDKESRKPVSYVISDPVSVKAAASSPTNFAALYQSKTFLVDHDVRVLDLAGELYDRYIKECIKKKQEPSLTYGHFCTEAHDKIGLTKDEEDVYNRRLAESLGIKQPPPEAPGQQPIRDKDGKDIKKEARKTKIKGDDGSTAEPASDVVTKTEDELKREEVLQKICNRIANAPPFKEKDTVKQVLCDEFGVPIEVVEGLYEEAVTRSEIGFVILSELTVLHVQKLFDVFAEMLRTISATAANSVPLIGMSNLDQVGEAVEAQVIDEWEDSKPPSRQLLTVFEKFENVTDETRQEFREANLPQLHQACFVQAFSDVLALHFDCTQEEAKNLIQLAKAKVGVEPGESGGSASDWDGDLFAIVVQTAAEILDEFRANNKVVSIDSKKPKRSTTAKGANSAKSASPAQSTKATGATHARQGASKNSKAALKEQFSKKSNSKKAK